MSIAARLGAVGALIAVLVMGLSACQTQGTVTSIASDEADVTLPRPGSPSPKATAPSPPSFCCTAAPGPTGTRRIRPSGAA